MLLARLGEEIRVGAAHRVELLLERDAAGVVAVDPLEQLLGLADGRPQLLLEQRLGALRASALLGGLALGGLARLALRAERGAQLAVLREGRHRSPATEPPRSLGLRLRRRGRGRR